MRNAVTVLGPGWGAAVLAADMAKGAVAGAAGRSIAGPTGAYVAATASIAGHIVPGVVRGGGRCGSPVVAASTPQRVGPGTDGRPSVVRGVERCDDPHQVPHRENLAMIEPVMDSGAMLPGSETTV